MCNNIPLQVAVDLIGPLPVTAGGNQFIVTMIDYFTKWPEAAALPSKSADGIAQYKMYYVFGCAKVMITDQGREFVNHINEVLMQLAGTLCIHMWLVTIALTFFVLS